MKKRKFNNLKDARANIGKTQDSIAKEAGISKSYYNMIENGKRGMSINTAARIAKVFGISIDELFSLCSFTGCEQKVN